MTKTHLRGRRIKSWALVLSLAILSAATSMLPRLALAADPGPIALYAPTNLGMGVLNQAMLQNEEAYKAFYAKYVTAHSAFNQVSRFGPVQLLYGGQYIRPDYDLSLVFPALSPMDTLRKKGDLQVLARATVHSVMHKGPSHKKTETVTTTALRLGQKLFGDQDILAYRYCTDEVTQAIAVGDYAWTAVKMNLPYDEATFKLRIGTSSKIGCSCGDARISNISIAFGDFVRPILQAVTITKDPDGFLPHTSFGEGDTLYIHLYFDEFVRFSDNSANHDNVGLYLDVFDTGDQKITGSNVIARLHSLKDKRVTFAYTVPDTITVGTQTVPTNHYIGGISSVQPDLLGGSTKFDLAILDNNGNAVSVPAYDTLSKTSSLITDLAGNPVSSLATAIDQSKRCRIDSVNPSVREVNVAHTSRDTVFAGPGEQLVFSATFSEPLDVGAAGLGGVIGTVNLVRRSDATAVTVSAESISGDRQTLVFEPLTITPDMKPVSTTIGGKQITYATLTSIVFPGGANDLCGNPYDGAVGKAPNQQYYVDTLGPTVTPGTGLIVHEGRLIPVPPTTPGSAGFCFPFTLTDSTADGAHEGDETFTSGVEGEGSTATLQGKLAWVNPLDGVEASKFEFAVTASPETPTTGWQAGYTEVGSSESRYAFDQIPGGNLNYLHIRLLDSEQYNIASSSIAIYPRDLAGNEGSAVFPLEYVADRVGPGYVKAGYKTTYDSGTARGQIEAFMRVVDPSKVDPSTIRYRWTTDGTAVPDPEGDGWTDYPSPGDSAASFDLSIATPDSDLLELGGEYTRYLFITSKDQLGNESVSPPFRFDIDLSYPAAGVEVRDELSTDPALVLTPPRSNQEGKPSTILVMIKDPLGWVGDEYFVRTFNSTDPAEAKDILSGLIWTVNPPDYSGGDLRKTLESWRYVRLVSDGNLTLHDGSVVEVAYGFAHHEAGRHDIAMRASDLYFSHTSSASEIATAQRLLAIVGGKYYGDIEVTLIAGYGATGPGVWEKIDHTAAGDVYAVNVKNNGIFFNDAAYYWDAPLTDEYVNKIGYYYDHDLTEPVRLPYAIYPDSSPLTGRFVSYIPSGSPVATQTFILRAASYSVVLVQSNNDSVFRYYAPSGSYGSVTYTLPGVYAVTIDPENKDLLAGFSDWDSPADGPRCASTLDGQEIVVTLANRIAPSWGVADIDFSSPETYLSVELMSSTDPEAPPSGTEICRTKLAPEAEQVVTLPATTWYSGRYRIVVQAKAKMSDALSVGIYEDIYVDRTAIPQFGLARVDSSVVAGVGGETIDRTTQAWYGYDSVSKPDEVYANPRLLLGNSTGDGVASLTHTLFFTAKSAGIQFAPGVRFGDLAIRVWNHSSSLSDAEAEAGMNAAKWVPLSTTCGEGLKTVVVTDKGLLSSNYVASDGTPQLPLLAGQENIIRYQVGSSNGMLSDVGILFATVSDEQPEIEVELDPSSSDKVLTHTTATVTRLASQTYEGVAAFYWDGVQGVPAAEPIRLTRSGTHVFFATNAYGNYTFIQKDVDFVDGTPPTIADADGGSMYDDRFELKYIISDNYMPGGKIPKGLSFYLRFDEDYNQALGNDPDDFFEIQVPDYTSDDQSDHFWKATEPSASGVYEVIASPLAGGNQVLVTVIGVFKYDPSGGATASHPVYVYAKDVAGNESAVLTDSAQMDNIRPSVTVNKTTFTPSYGGGFDYIDVYAEFIVPAFLDAPVPLVAQPEFSRETHYLPIYADTPAYEISFTDIFGDRYSPDSVGQYHIDPVPIACIGDYSLQVTLSTTEPTGEDVRVELKRVSDAMVFSAWKGGVRFAVDAASGETTLEENNTILCMMRVGGDIQCVEIPVTNLFKSPPTATVMWYYSEFGSNDLPPGVTQTTGEVTAYLTPASGRRLYPANGTSDRYTFTYGDTTSSSYTFEFVDAAGNPGEPLTVYLPVRIVMPEEPGPDSDPPEYHMEIYATQRGLSSRMGAWSNMSGWSGAYGSIAATLDAISWTSGYLLDFDTITDVSPTRLLLLPADGDLATLSYEDSQSAGDIPGVTLKGRTIAVSSNASFIAAVIDSRDNYTAVSITTTLIDTEAPAIHVETVKTDFYKARVYANVTDDRSGVAGLVVPANAPRIADPASDYDGWYYFDFTENGTVYLVADDNAGNRAVATAEVTGLDTSAPVSWVDWWSPSEDDEPRRPPPGALNRDVSVGICFDRTVVSLSVSVTASGLDVDDANVGDYVKVDHIRDKAVLTFRKDADSVTLSYTGQNGKTGSRQFVRGTHYDFTIDKDAPGITVSSLAGLDVPTAKSVTVTFTVGAERVTTETGEVLLPGATVTRTISSRGTFVYRFFDEAGNVTEKTIEVKNIDVEPPVIMVMGEDNGGVYKSGSHTFYATLSEKGTITFGGESRPVRAPVDRNGDGKLSVTDLLDPTVAPADRECEWIPLTVTQNGTYEIVAVDQAGRASSTYVTVSCLDNLAPSIAFSPPATLSVKEGTPIDDFLAMFQVDVNGVKGKGLEGVVVSDFVSAPDNIQLSVDLAGWDQARLNRPGTATVNYVATDEAGNARTVARYVRIYPKDELVVIVNGQKTENDSTTVFIGETQFTIGIENLAGGQGEPVKIYLLPGRYTAGQMKSLASEVGRTFTVSGKGTYTLYIVSQSRNAYLTYLYIQ